MSYSSLPPNKSIMSGKCGSLCSAFTMSEVLVALGVLGVVVAITLGVLMYGHEKQVLATQLEKAKSVIANGYRLMAAQQDVTDFKSLSFWTCKDFACFQREHKDIFKVVLDAKQNNFSIALRPEYYNAAYADVVVSSTYKDEINDKLVDIYWKRYEYAFITPDGFVMGLTALDYNTKEELYIVLDVNNSAKPNKVGEDLFVLQMKDWALTDKTRDFLNDNDDSKDEEEKTTPDNTTPQEPEVEEDDDTTSSDKDKDKDEDNNKDKDNNGNNGNGNNGNKDKDKDTHGYGTNNGKGNGAQNQNGNGHGNWIPELNQPATGESTGGYSDFNPDDYKGDIGGSSDNSSVVPDDDEDDKKNNGNNGNGNGNKDEDKDKSNNGNGNNKNKD